MGDGGMGRTVKFDRVDVRAGEEACEGVAHLRGVSLASFEVSRSQTHLMKTDCQQPKVALESVPRATPALDLLERINCTNTVSLTSLTPYPPTH